MSTEIYYKKLTRLTKYVKYGIIPHLELETLNTTKDTNKKEKIIDDIFSKYNKTFIEEDDNDE